MLLKKRILILLFNKTLINKFINFYYYFLILNYFNCCFYQTKLIKFNLKYFYLLKLITYDKYFLNLKINSIIESMYCLNVLNKCSFVKNLTKSNSFFSLIRSPFVYKKSMEQIFLEKFKSIFKSENFYYNFFLQEYQEEQLKKFFKKELILKYCYKLILNSTKNYEKI